MSAVAFLGTGTMGLPMAANLMRAGLTVRAYNRSPERARPLAEDGAEVLADPRTAAEGCSLMVTMLSDGDTVLEVAERALEGFEGTWIQTSTIGVDAAGRCGELAARHGVGYVDAPVLGTREPAREGKLIVLASGPEHAREACRPVFEAIGSRTIWLGPAGAGSRLKVVVNGWILGVVAVLAETIALAQGLGTDPQGFFDAVADGPLDLPYARIKGAAMMAGSFDDVSFRLSLARKDGELVLAAAAEAGVELPVAEAVVARLRDAEESGHGDDDMAATFRAGAPA